MVYFHGLIETGRIIIYELSYATTLMISQQSITVFLTPHNSFDMKATPWKEEYKI
jgi:hypothetical protein